MQRYRRNTVTYKGVKVRYSHLFMLVDGLEYTTTEIDERNLESILRAYARKGNLVCSYEYPSVRKGLTKALFQQEIGYFDLLREIANSAK